MRSTCHIFCKTSPSTLHRCLSSLALRAAASTSPTATGEAAVWESVMARQRPARLAAQPPGLPKQGQSKLNVLLVFLCWCSRSALGLLRAKPQVIRATLAINTVRRTCITDRCEAHPAAHRCRRVQMHVCRHAQVFRDHAAQHCKLVRRDARHWASCRRFLLRGEEEQALHIPEGVAPRGCHGNPPGLLRGKGNFARCSEKAERALHPGQSRIEIGFIRSGQIFRTSHVNGEGPIWPHYSKKT